MSVINKEMAEQEFDRFVEMMDLDLETDNMDEEDRKSLNIQKSMIVREIEKGSLTIDENGEPSYTPQRSDNKNTIVFHEPTGASLMATDQRKKGADVSKMYAMIADITGEPAKRFAQMKMKDLKVCQAITALFMG